MAVFDHPSFDDHERVIAFADSRIGFRAFIAIHSTFRGPAIGGCRLKQYSSSEDALGDALRLSRSMSYKSAVAGLPWGGGKAVIMAPDGLYDREALILRLADSVETLTGSYITSNDLGTTVHDVERMLERTQYAVGLPDDTGRQHPATAYGVLRGMQGAAKSVLGSDDLSGMHVAIQGVGEVGAQLAEYILEQNGHITITDLDDQRLQHFRGRPNVQFAETDEIYGVDCDVFAPCAIGGTLNEKTIADLKARLICGAANNQLITPPISDALQKRNITYVPDYVANVGGVIEVTPLVEGDAEKSIMEACDTIFYTVEHLITEAREQNVTPVSLANSWALERIGRDPN